MAVRQRFVFPPCFLAHPLFFKSLSPSSEEAASRASLLPLLREASPSDGLFHEHFQMLGLHSLQLNSYLLKITQESLEKEMATHSSVLAWRIPGMGEPGGLPSVGSHRVGRDRSNLAAVAVALSQTEKAMAPHSSTLAWKIPWTEEPGRLQSMGS